MNMWRSCTAVPASMKKETAFKTVQTKFSLSPIGTLLILKQIPNNNCVQRCRGVNKGDSGVFLLNKYAFLLL